MSSRLPLHTAAAALVASLWTCPAAADPSELPPQFAYNYGQTETPRMGGVGAMHALGGGISAIYANPANLGITRAYHIGAIGQFTPEAARQMYGGAIMDSTRRFSGGVSFIGGFQDPDGIDRSSIDVRIALAFAVTKAVHLGVGGRYVSIDQDGLGPLGHSRASGGLVDADEPGGRLTMVNTATIDAGVTIRPIDELHLSAFGQNLTYPDNGLLPTIVGGAIGWGTKDYSIEVDALADLNSYARPSPRVMVGGEYLLVDRVPLRLGYRWDMLNGSGADQSHALSAGAGYVSPQFGVEASVRRTLVGPSATVILVGLSYHLESLGLEMQPY